MIQVVPPSGEKLSVSVAVSQVPYAVSIIDFNPPDTGNVYELLFPFAVCAENRLIVLILSGVGMGFTYKKGGGTYLPL